MVMTMPLQVSKKFLLKVGNRDADDLVLLLVTFSIFCIKYKFLKSLLTMYSFFGKWQFIDQCILIFLVSRCCKFNFCNGHYLLEDEDFTGFWSKF